MNNRYVELEQYKQLPKYKQVDIIKWWKDNKAIGDLVSSYPSRSLNRNLDFVIRIKSNGNIVTARNDCSVEDCIPLLNETQCREYIEYKTECTVEVRHIYAICGYDITICGIEENTYTIEQEDNNLLQAYWEVIKQL